MPAGDTTARYLLGLKVREVGAKAGSGLGGSNADGVCLLVRVGVGVIHEYWLRRRDECRGWRDGDKLDYEGKDWQQWNRDVSGRVSNYGWHWEGGRPEVSRERAWRGRTATSLASASAETDSLHFDSDCVDAHRF